MFPVTRQVRRKRTRVSGRRESTRGEHATAPGEHASACGERGSAEEELRGEPGSTHAKGGLGGNVRGGLGGETKSGLGESKGRLGGERELPGQANAPLAPDGQAAHPDSAGSGGTKP
jgi:hypothetical protein